MTCDEENGPMIWLSQDVRWHCTADRIQLLILWWREWSYHLIVSRCEKTLHSWQNPVTSTTSTCHPIEKMLCTVVNHLPGTMQLFLYKAVFVQTTLCVIKLFNDCAVPSVAKNNLTPMWSQKITSSIFIYRLSIKKEGYYYLIKTERKNGADGPTEELTFWQK